MNLAEKIVEKNADIGFRIIGGNALIIKSANRMAFTLNETGTAIWKSVDNKRSVMDLIEIIQKEFNAPKGKVERDVLEFIGELRRQGIVLLK